MDKDNKTDPFFKEVQRVRQIWIWIFVILLAGLFWYFFVMQVIMGIQFGSRPAPNVIFVIFWLLFGIGFPLLFISAKLITEVRNDGVYIKYFPIHWTFRKMAFKDLKRYEARTYKPIREYGGWGIRIGRKGMAYNMSGNKGVQLELFNNKRLLIGSRRHEELFQAIHVKYSEQNSG
jgi:hypothetical protein